MRNARIGDAEEGGVLTATPLGVMAPGTLVDVTPLHVLTTGSLKQLAVAAGRPSLDVRRFRPNLVVGSDGVDGYPELRWVGGELAIGEQVCVHVVAPMPRCVVVALPQGDEDRDMEVLRAIAREQRIDFPGIGSFACLGVGAEATTDGVLRAGDAVALSEPGG